MTGQQAAKPSGSNRTQIVFFVLCCYLLATFLYRVLVPAHEYPRLTERVITMALDALCLAGLIGTRTSGPKALFWAALIAGIGLFAIRLNGDASWSTGHWSYFLLPR
jgi:uncharacterized membrane protein